jgi:hypothetical protein
MQLFQLFCFSLLQFASSKILVFPDEKIEKCQEFLDKDAGHFNYDSFEIITVSDTEIFLNGSIKIIKELKAPWVSEIYAEQFVRNSCIQTPLQRKFNDICPHLHNPLEIWYKLMKNVQGCDYKEGVRTLGVPLDLRLFLLNSSEVFNTFRMK